MAWERIGLAHGALQGRDTLEQVARAFSYRKVKRQERDAEISPKKPSVKGKQSRDDGKTTKSSGTRRPPARFIKVHSRTPLAPPSEVPHFLEDPSLELEEDCNGTYVFPFSPPLRSMAQMVPLFFTGLGRSKKSARLDQKKMLSALAKGKPLVKLPYLRQQRWPGRLQIIVDTADRLEPYWHDFEHIVTGLQDLLGREAVEPLRFIDQRPAINGECAAWPRPEEGRWQPYRLPLPDVSILVLSDFGMFGGADIQADWQRFAEELLRHPGPVLSLSPAQESPPDGRLCRKLRPVHLGDCRPMARSPGNKGFRLDRGAETDMTTILTLLAALPVVSCSLLRPLRQQLGWGSSVLEGEIWNHSHLQPVSIGKYIVPSEKKNYEKKYRSDLSGQAVTKTFWQICDAHHQTGFAGLRHLQTICRLALEDQEVPREIVDYLQQLNATVWQGKGESRQEQAKTLLCLMPAAAWDSAGMRQDLQHLYCAIHRRELQNEQWPEQMPSSIDLRFLASISEGIEGQPKEHWLLIQTSDQGRLQLLKKTGRSSAHNTPIAKITSLAGQPLFVCVAGDVTRYRIDGNAAIEIFPPLCQDNPTGRKMEIRFFDHGQSGSKTVPLPQTGSAGLLRIDSVLETILIDWQLRRPWMASLQRDKHGLTAISESADKSRHAYQWMAGEQDQQGRVLKRGVWRLPPDVEKKILGADGYTIGRDQYGLYVDLMVKSIIQRFRWCEPGTFMMGSPPDEPERYNDEVLHQVTLTRGFWLADTTVTQALWQAVMGNKPSRFKGAERPVERVSWKDAQDFIKKLNGMVPGLSARLPWEAEWEYACRAGTTTPFSFGANITPEQVNYDGNYPYDNGKKGFYRQEPVVVKSLPCNAWGFYEMHGNVWEWCQDYYQEDLGVESAVDPHGPDTGDFRVVRGGSWFDGGGRVRSACRLGNVPGYRLSIQGFRLSLGHELR